MLTVWDLENAVQGLREHRTEELRRVNFEEIHQLLGVHLPRDFRELAESYSTLEFDEFLRVPIPTPGKEREYVDGMLGELEILRELQEDGMSEGYVPHPEPGGLIPWSESLSGDVFYWRVSAGIPEEWPIVVNSRNMEWWEYAGGALDFLVGLINGSIERRGLPMDVPGRNPEVRMYGH